MKLRDLLRKFRLHRVDREAERRIDDSNVDALTTVGGAAPTNLVPSQQDERPRH